MRILVGVDGTEGSLAAVRQVGRWFESDGGPVYLYYSPPAIRFADAPAPDAATRERLAAAMVQAVFERAKAELPASMRPRVECRVGSQSARHGLLVAADETRADLLVVGSHGLRTVERLMVGSVGRALAHHATIPVLVVREQPARAAAGDFRVLVACDRTDASRSAHEVLRQFSWPANTCGEVVSVFETMVGEIPGWLRDTLAREAGGNVPSDTFEFFAEDKQQAERELHAWTADLPEPWKSCGPQLISGDASRALVDRLREHPVDVVVVGGRRQGPLTRWILGSTSDAILNHAPCSVLIARQHERA
jgi:nucleotide-binding universal stress UspA family protein